MSASIPPNGRPAVDNPGYLIRRVRIRNFKSIARCDIELGPLTVLVGRNGSGKSNVLDALRFVSDGLRGSLDQALRDRGGAGEVRRRGGPISLSIQVELVLSGGRHATYGFKLILAGRFKTPIVSREDLKIVDSGCREIVASYSVRRGRPLRSSVEIMPPVAEDRLYLVNAAGLPAFREVYDALLAVGFYNLNPEAMKALQSPDDGKILHRDGRNIASVVGRIASERPEVWERLRSYLATIVPGVADVGRESLGPTETLVFSQEVEGADRPKKFYAFSMSDGTLRALGALVAVNQLAEGPGPVRLVGIEEPEAALHPAASGALMDALREAASHTQVLVTTHSPDLLDQIEFETDHLLAVQARRGETQIGPTDAASRKAIRDHLYTAGDLLRMDQLEPDQADLRRQEQVRLFEGVGGAG